VPPWAASGSGLCFRNICLTIEGGAFCCGTLVGAGIPVGQTARPQGPGHWPTGLPAKSRPLGLQHAGREAWTSLAHQPVWPLRARQADGPGRRLNRHRRTATAARPSGGQRCYRRWRFRRRTRSTFWAWGFVALSFQPCMGRWCPHRGFARPRRTCQPTLHPR
jgi:hypothetical protein